MGRSNHSPYLDMAMENTSGVIERALEILRGHEFDAICVTGVSGLLIGPILAYVLEKDLIVIRKTLKDSHAEYVIEHNSCKEARWIFVDDLIASGETIKRVEDAMEDGGFNPMIARYLYNADDLRLGCWMKREVWDAVEYSKIQEGE